MRWTFLPCPVWQWRRVQLGMRDVRASSSSADLVHFSTTVYVCLSINTISMRHWHTGSPPISNGPRSWFLYPKLKDFSNIFRQSALPFYLADQINVLKLFPYVADPSINYPGDSPARFTRFNSPPCGSIGLISFMFVISFCVWLLAVDPWSIDKNMYSGAHFACNSFNSYGYEWWCCKGEWERGRRSSHRMRGVAIGQKEEIVTCGFDVFKA